MSTDSLPRSSTGRAVASVAMMFFFNGALFGAWASRVPAVKAQYSLTEAALGTLLLVLAGGAVVSFPLAGRAIDRFGCGRVSLILACVNAIALVAIGISGSVTTLALALALFGASHGGMDVAMNSWGGLVEKRRKLQIMSRLHAVWSLGAGCGALSGALASLLDAGLAPHFAVVATLLAALSVLLVKEENQPLQHSQSDSVAFALPSGGLLLLGIIAFCASLGEGAMADWSAVYLSETLHLSTALAASGYAVFSVAMVATRLSGDWIIRLLAPARALQLAGASATVGALTLVTAARIEVAWFALLLLGAGFALVMPIAFSRAANHPHISAGRATAATATLGYGGMLLGPPLIGLLASVISLRLALAVLVLGAIVIALLAKPATRAN